MLGLQLPPSDRGLQYVLPDGTWVEPVIDGTDIVLCNIGRMLQSASDSRLRPSTHRVHCTDPASGYRRLSSVLFSYPPHKARQWKVTQDGLEVLDATWGTSSPTGSTGSASSPPSPPDGAAGRPSAGVPAGHRS